MYSYCTHFKEFLKPSACAPWKLKINRYNFGCILGKLEIALRRVWVIFYYHAFNCSCHEFVSFCWKLREPFQSSLSHGLTCVSWRGRCLVESWLISRVKDIVKFGYLSGYSQWTLKSNSYFKTNLFLHVSAFWKLIFPLDSLYCSSFLGNNHSDCSYQKNFHLE